MISKTIFQSLLIVFSIFFLFQCKNTKEELPAPPQEKTQSCLIDSMITEDGEITTFNYNNNNQLTLIENWEGEKHIYTYVGDTVTHQSFIKEKYRGFEKYFLDKDGKATSKIRVSYANYYHTYDTSFFYYDLQKNLLKDSTVENTLEEENDPSNIKYRQTVVRNYDWNNGNIINISTKTISKEGEEVREVRLEYDLEKNDAAGFNLVFEDLYFQGNTSKNLLIKTIEASNSVDNYTYKIDDDGKVLEYTRIGWDTISNRLHYNCK